MKVTLTSTSRVLEVVVHGQPVPARVWEGETEHGVPVFAFITRIAPAIEISDLTREQLEEFERDLQEQRAPSVPIAAIPARLIL